MSDRLYLRHLNIGLAGASDDETIGAPTDAYLTIVPTARFTVHPFGTIAVSLTYEEAESLRDKLSEWLSGEEHTQRENARMTVNHERDLPEFPPNVTVRDGPSKGEALLLLTGVLIVSTLWSLPFWIAG